MMTRLDSIATRSKSNRLMIAVFAAMLGVATFVSATGVGTVVTHNLASR